jgi:hypothetical protein
MTTTPKTKTVRTPFFPETFEAATIAVSGHPRWGRRFWNVRDAEGRFARIAHAASLGDVWNDANDHAHSTPNCPAVTGDSTRAARDDAGWLCATCVWVERMPARAFWSGSIRCRSCEEWKPAKRFPTVTNSPERETQCRKCRDAEPDEPDE